MDNFNISHTAIGDLGARGLSQCVKNIRSLSVEKCEITDVGIEYISQGIHELTTSMEEVKFAKNPINVRSAIAIASCLHNIDNLHVRSCRINDLAAEQLAKGVERRTTKMKMLNLTYNEFGDTGAEFFRAGLRNLVAMRVWKCGITRVEFRRLLAAHRRLEPPRPKIWFGEVEGYEGGDMVLEPE
uniref:Uncharacterized protein n=2 Tax=Ciona intestinalis TaxID=7719 RepID=F6YEX1_CIOIN